MIILPVPHLKQEGWQGLTLTGKQQPALLKARQRFYFKSTFTGTKAFIQGLGLGLGLGLWVRVRVRVSVNPSVASPAGAPDDSLPSTAPGVTG